MEDTFRHTRQTTIWFVTALVVGFVASLQADSGFKITAGIGLAAIMISGVVGSFRTGRFFTWSGPVVPNQFEGIVGWTGAMLMIAAFIGLVIRAALGKNLIL